MKGNKEIKEINQIKESKKQIEKGKMKEDVKRTKDKEKLAEFKSKECLTSKNKVEELLIELYPENKPKQKMFKNSPKYMINEGTLGYSFDINKPLGFVNSGQALLVGFYEAYLNHYPIRIKPDDIWLLIVQAFSHHVDINSQELREYFVNFNGKKTLEVLFDCPIKNINKKMLEQFSIEINKQMEAYLGKEILETLTSDYTTTTNDSLIVSKISIICAFKNYFHCQMRKCICGFPYIIIEGTSSDYQKMIVKAKKLRKYKFGWYVDRIIPHLKKIVEAKEGNIDVDFFKKMISNSGRIEPKKVCQSPKDTIYGWILDFFGFIKKGISSYQKFNGGSLELVNFQDLASQLLDGHFTLIGEQSDKKLNMEFKVGFIGCDQNEKMELSPVQGWIVSKRQK